MKRFILIILFILIAATGQAQVNLSALPTTTPQPADRLYMIESTGPGTWASRGVTIASMDDKIRRLTRFDGANFGAKLQAAHNDCPSTGCEIDAQGMEAGQAITTTVTFTKRVKLKLGASVITCSADPCISTSAGLSMEGLGLNLSTFIISSASGKLLDYAAADAAIIKDITIQSTVRQTSGAYISITGPGGGLDNNRSLVENVNFRFGYDSLTLGEVYGTTVRNCDFTAIQRNGIVINHTSNSDQGIISIEGNNRFVAETAGATGVTGILMNAASGVVVIGGYFSVLDYGFRMNWTGNTTGGQLQIISNHFEAQKTAAISLERGGGITSLYGGVVIASNWGRGDTAGSNNGAFVKVPTNGTQWLAFLKVNGNFFYNGDTAKFIDIGNTALGVADLTGNTVYCAGGTSSGITVGTGISELLVDPNYIRCPVLYSLGSAVLGTTYQGTVSFNSSGDNCTSSASPAVCGTATAGSAAIPVGATSIQINTTAVTTNSVILVQPDSTVGTKLGITCNTSTDQQQVMYVNGKSTGSAFVVTVPIAPSTNKLCLDWAIIR